MIKVLFLCHGNICRSPMSEYILRDLVTRRGLADHFQIASAATSREEIGNPVYPPARRILKAHGIDCMGKTARQMTKAVYAEYDYLLAAENYNIRNMMRILSTRSAGCWISRTGPGTSRTPGTPETLKSLGTTSWKAARPSWRTWKEKERFDSLKKERQVTHQ